MTANQQEKRKLQIKKAAIAAAQPPSEVAELSERIIEIAAKVAGDANPNLVSDIAVAVVTAKGALESSIVNVEINYQSIESKGDLEKLDKLVAESVYFINTADKIVFDIKERIRR